MNSRRLMSDTALAPLAMFVTSSDYYQSSRRPAVGFPHVQPAAQRPESPWARPESLRQEAAALRDFGPSAAGLCPSRVVCGRRQRVKDFLAFSLRSGASHVSGLFARCS
jgi:hypothetical protein